MIQPCRIAEADTIVSVCLSELSDVGARDKPPTLHKHAVYMTTQVR